MKRILFVCSANKDRSKTADDYFSEKFPQLEFDSCGTNLKLCAQEGTTPLDEELVEWAELVLVMEEKHRKYINTNTRKNHGHKIRVLHIADVYPYFEPALIELLEKKAEPFFG